MFSKKYKEELLKEKIDKLSQLDKIEFNQRQLYSNIINSKILNLQSCIWIVEWIFLGLYAIFGFKFASLKYLGFDKLAELYLYGSITSLVFSGIMFLLIVIIECVHSKKQKEFFEENEKFLEERLKK